MRPFHQRVFGWIETLAQDLRYAVRSLRRVPGLVAVSVLSLGLGIGLNLTLYAGVTTIFRHQPTMTEPAKVVGIEPGNGRQFSYQNYRDLRDSGTFSGVVGFRMSAMNRRAGDEPRHPAKTADSVAKILGEGLDPAEHSLMKRSHREFLFVPNSANLWRMDFVRAQSVLHLRLVAAQFYAIWLLTTPQRQTARGRRRC